MEEGINRWIIAGLGNPGREYRETRHNVGFFMIDQLSNTLQIPLNKIRNKAIVGEGTNRERRIILVKPQTFMNLSGSAIVQLMRFYKVPFERLLVIHDDLDLPVGKIRIRPGGGSAGQKGMTSVISQLGSDEFPRLRIGIGRPTGRMEVADFVLTTFTKADQEIMAATFLQAEKAVLMWLEEGINAAMNCFNGLNPNE